MITYYTLETANVSAEVCVSESLGDLQVGREGEGIWKKQTLWSELNEERRRFQNEGGEKKYIV